MIMYRRGIDSHYRREPSGQQHSSVFEQDRNERLREDYEYGRSQRYERDYREDESVRSRGSQHYYSETVRERSPVSRYPADYEYKQRSSGSRYEDELYRDYKSHSASENKDSRMSKPVFEGPDGNIKIDPKELKKITVSIKRSIPSGGAVPVEHHSPDVVVFRRPGEGTKPIFYRSEILEASAMETKAAATTTTAPSEPRMVAIIREPPPPSIVSYSDRLTPPRLSGRERIVESVPSYRSSEYREAKVSRMNEYYEPSDRYESRDKEYRRRDDAPHRSRDREEESKYQHQTSRRSVWGRLGPPERKYDSRDETRDLVHHRKHEYDNGYNRGERRSFQRYNNEHYSKRDDYKERERYNEYYYSSNRSRNSQYEHDRRLEYGRKY